MDSDIYGIIPSPSTIGALQSRSEEEVSLQMTEYGYVLDDFHALELTRPQLHFITSIEPQYMRNIQVSSEVIRKVAVAHPDIYIVDNNTVYIDPTIYSAGEIEWYIQELFRLAYKTQIGISGKRI